MALPATERDPQLSRRRKGASLTTNHIASRPRRAVARVGDPQPVNGATRHRNPAPTRAFSGWLWFAAWVLSRAIMAWTFVTTTSFIAYDVQYYFRGVNNVTTLADRLVEYPVPVVWLLQIVRAFSGPQQEVYVYLFTVLILLLDLAMTVLLWRCVDHRAATYWAGFTFLVGPLIWYRIDLIPAVFVALAMYWLNKRPRAAGAMIALGAATKLWPAMLIVPLLGYEEHGRQRAQGFVVTGGLIGMASWITEGWARSISPLTWQTGRGLQIESVMATWPMLQRAFDPAYIYQVALSKYNAWELFGPHIDTLVWLADRAIYATILLVLVLGWLIVLGGVGLPNHAMQAAARPEARRVRTHAMMVSMLAIISAVMIANKTFSPQYMIWLSGPLAMLGTMQLGHQDARHARALGLLGLAAAGLTQLVFPLNYAGLISGSHADPVPTVLLVTRNLIMVIITCYSSYLAIKVSLRVGSTSYKHRKMPRVTAHGELGERRGSEASSFQATRQTCPTLMISAPMNGSLN